MREAVASRQSPHLTAIAVLLLAAFAATPSANAAAGGAPPGAILIGQFTTGGCIHVCEVLPMCKDAHINEKNGDCRLVFDRQHADFRALMESCPGPGERTFSADRVGGQWQIACAAK